MLRIPPVYRIRILYVYTACAFPGACGDQSCCIKSQYQNALDRVISRPASPSVKGHPLLKFYNNENRHGQPTSTITFQKSILLPP
ncbi:hypothetical protein BKA67DRAFT_557332, partial [Truncatella angustata]